MIRSTLVLCLFIQFAYASPDEQWVRKTALSVPGFVPNKGQFIDQHQHANDEVQYLYSNGMFNLQLKQDGFSYELFRLVEVTENRSGDGYEYDPFIATSEMSPQFEFHSTRIDVKFLGAAVPQLSPSDETGTLLNYYTVHTGSNGITGVKSYNNVSYKNVYPGIDLHFYAPDEAGQPLKYEWLVQPGADPSQIKMEYAGATSLQLKEDGSFDVLTTIGKLNEGKIFAYTMDDEQQTYAAYSIDRNIISYTVKGSNSKTLVIDPNITWFSYYGGSKNEDLFEGEMAFDGKGSPLIAGNTSSPQNIASTGAHQVTYGDGGVDGFVAKFKPNGNMAWATYYGSYDRDGCHAIAADAAYNIFVGGNTFSSSGIATAGCHQEVFGGAMDAFFVKFNKDGIRQWATYFGGTGYGDQVNGVECDASGTVYFTGYTCSPNNISTPGAYQEVYNGVDDETGDVMVGAFTTDGALLWCSYHSGPSQDRAHDIVLLENGDFYVEGTCESTTQFATAGIHQSTYGGGPQDAFISKWSADGDLYWCSYYGGEGDEHGRGLAIDSNNNAYIGGWTISTVGIGTPGTAQPDWFPGYNSEGNPAADAYLAKFTPEGMLAWGTYYGGKDLERSRGIAVDKKNDVVYMVGQTNSKFNVANSSIFDPDNGLKQQDGFVSRYSTSGTLLYSYLVGGPGKQTVFDADLDKYNSLYLLMTTDATTYTTFGVHQSTANGEEDAMLIKMNPADSCLDQYEPNNTNQIATEMSASADTLFYGITGNISNSTDIDWFRLKTGFTNLKLELMDLVTDYDLYFYKSNGQLIATAANIGDADETIIINSLPKGKYYIRVVPANTTYDPNSCYRLRALISFQPWLTKEGTLESTLNQSGIQVHTYPNPAKDILSLKITAPYESTANVSIFDLSGQTILEKVFTIEEGSQTITLDVAALRRGMYLIATDLNGVRSLSKIVLQ
jgi:hypothetical protein